VEEILYNILISKYFKISYIILCVLVGVTGWKRRSEDRFHILGTRIRDERFVYYELFKRELKTKPKYEFRCDERLKTKVEESTHLVYTQEYCLHRGSNSGPHDYQEV
jgi:hypothetical protein